MLSFLTPLFIAGLAALAIPILIHLVHRQERERTAFPSLMFIRQIPYQERRRRTIRHWALLALRCLALALLVLAFMRPYWFNAEQTAALADRHDRVIVIDQSYSMSYDDHWQQAPRMERPTQAQP